MYQVFDRDREKTKYYILFAFIITALFLVTVVYKNDEKITNKNVDLSIQYSEIKSIKEFLLNKINSPFTNINHEIKKGESIQKILKKYKIPNNEIQAVIIQYKKYSNPKNLLTGDKIEIVIEKNLQNKIRFSLNKKR